VIQREVLRLISRVLFLGFVTTAFALVMAVPVAWLVVRTDLPGRRIFRWLAAVPLAVPPYIGAISYVVLLAPGGQVHKAIAGLLDKPLAQVSYPGTIFSIWGAAFVLGLFTYPYIYLIVQTALEKTDPRLEEAAQSMGAKRFSTFTRITLPLLRPAITGGALLVFMYALVDFGVVALLRVSTFTTVVYNYLLAGFSLPTAAGLSMVLVGLIWVTLTAQRKSLGARRYTQIGSAARNAASVTLGRAKWLALGYVLLVLTLALFLPLGMLISKAIDIGSVKDLISFWADQKGFLWNTFVMSSIGSGMALVFATFVALRWRSGGQGWLTQGVVQAGFAVPGTVLGIALVGFYLDVIPWLYATPIAVSLAYLILFSAPALQGVQAAISQVHPSIEEAARVMGRRLPAVYLKIIIPLIWPGIISAWATAFILMSRELAATLILRPPGYDTLAVRVWVHTVDVGPDPSGAALSLLLIGFIGLAWLGLLLLRLPSFRVRAPMRSEVEEKSPITL
jgi:iron(III) transport system permease protein